MKNDGTEVVKVIGSFAEFEEVTGRKLDDYHLPQVMDVTFECDGAECITSARFWTVGLNLAQCRLLNSIIHLRTRKNLKQVFLPISSLRRLTRHAVGFIV